MTLLPANIDLAGAEAMLLMRAGREYALKRALAKLADQLRRGDHRLPAVAGRAHPQRADRRRRGDRAAAVRDAGPPRGRPVPAHGRRRPADHQPGPQAAGRAADAVRLAHHAQPRRAARRRRPLRPAGAVAADPAHRAVRRGQRVGVVGAGRPKEQGRQRPTANWRRRCSSTGSRARRCRRSPRTFSGGPNAASASPRCSITIEPVDRGTTGPLPAGWSTGITR